MADPLDASLNSGQPDVEKPGEERVLRAVCSKNAPF